MNQGLQARLQSLSERFEELTHLLADPGVINDRQGFQKLSMEYADLGSVVAVWRAHQDTQIRLAEAELLAKEPDPELRALALDDKQQAEELLEALALELQRLLMPKDPNDDKNLFLEIRAGTGGQEASLFASDLFRAYLRYAERCGWRVEVLSSHESETGGFKEVIARIIGQGAYSYMKFESGTHRVQRVPATESQGRIHTSACTVAILPEIDEVDGVDINPADLKVDTYRSSGAGGQHVNTTDSAIRITHLPSGIVVECQDERSQHKNRARAMSLLSAKLLESQIEAQRSEVASERKLQVGSGDRSERIRTYNFPQGRVTDHRIGLTLYDLDAIIEGQLDLVIEPLQQAHQAEILSEMANARY